MTQLFETGLERREANYVPLTPIDFIARAAEVYGDRLAVVHGEQRYTWREAYARARRLAGALKEAGIAPWRHGGGDAAEHSADGRGALRRADGGRRAQHAQHAARRRPRCCSCCVTARRRC